MTSPKLALGVLAAVLLVLTAHAPGAAAACIRGQNGCALCNTAGTSCDVCQTAYGRLISGKVATCKKCTKANCMRCKGSSPNVCTVCAHSYYVTAQGACSKCPAHCSQCADLSGKCQKCVGPTWNQDAYSWSPVYSLASNGTCTLCAPTSPSGGYHLGWCAACNATAPALCTKCVDKNNGFPMFVQTDKDCGFCTSLHGDTCLKCRDGDGKCVACASGFVFDGVFSCKKA